jgi:hypothetical protein
MEKDKKKKKVVIASLYMSAAGAMVGPRADGMD